MMDDSTLAVDPATVRIRDTPHPTHTKLHKKPSWQAWKRRLNKKEDSKWIHKIANASFVLSSTGVIAVGVLTGFSRDSHLDLTAHQHLRYSDLCSRVVGCFNGQEISPKGSGKGASHTYIAISTCLLAFIAVWVTPHSADI